MNKYCEVCGKSYECKFSLLITKRFCGKVCRSYLYKYIKSHKVRKIKPTLKERFEDKIFKEKDCWIWKGTRMHKKNFNYGVFKVYGKQTLAHRVSYALYKEEIPDGMFVLHSCDNPPCVNPNHLRIGTIKDNNRDRSIRGRSPLEKLTRDEVKEIRESLANKSLNNKQISKKYNISYSYVSSIKHYRVWKDISI